MLVLFKKDKPFRAKMKKVTGFEKGRLMLDELFEFNKELVEDVASVDYQAELSEFKENAAAELDKLHKNLTELKEKITTMSEKKIHDIVHDAEKKVQAIKKKIQETFEDVNERFDLEGKVNNILAMIHTMKK